MKRKHIIAILLAAAIIVTASLVIGSFVTYAPPGPSYMEMQNIYIARIVKFSSWIIGIQVVTALIVLTEKKPK